MCPSPAASISDHPPSRAEAFYRTLLEFYPADFREQYREEMAQVFAATWSRLRSENLFRRLRYGAHVLRDWLSSLVKEWWVAAPWPTKWGAGGLVAAISLDITGHAYYEVLSWLVICVDVTVAGWLILHQRRLGKTWLAILTAGLAAIGFFIPIWLKPVQHLSIRESDCETIAKLISIAAGCLVSGYSVFRHQNALTQPKPLGAAPRPPGAYRMTLWTVNLSALVAGFIYFMAYKDYKGLSDGSQLLFASFALFTVLARSYFYSATAWNQSASR